MFFAFVIFVIADPLKARFVRHPDAEAAVRRRRLWLEADVHGTCSDRRLRAPTGPVHSPHFATEAFSLGAVAFLEHHNAARKSVIRAFCSEPAKPYDRSADKPDTCQKTLFRLS